MSDRPPLRRELSTPGRSRGIVAGVGRVAGALALTFLFAVLIEWVGIKLWWPEEGAGHSERLLVAEWRHLDRDTAEALRSSAAADSLRRGEAVLGRHLGATYAALCRATTCGESLAALSLYVSSARNIAKLFVVRVVVLAVAAPLVLLFGLVGLSEGLLRRDLRRWGGGRESSFVYHRSKALLGPLTFSASALYLASPIAIHPSWVLIPFGAAFGVVIAAVSGTFKKHL